MNSQKKEFHRPNYAFREAFAKVQEGKAVVVEAKRVEVGQRVRTLKNLSYETFMGSLVPQGVRRRADVYFNAKNHIRELGRKGGEEYAHAVTSVKYAYNDFLSNGRLGRSYRDAIEAIVPRELDKTVKAVDAEEIEVSDDVLQELTAEVQAYAGISSEVESSDGYARHSVAGVCAQ